MSYASSYGRLLLDQEKLTHVLGEADRLSEQFSRDHFLVFDSILKDDGLALLRDESSRMQQDAVRKEFDMDCMGSTKRRMTTLGAGVIDRLSSIVSGLYNDADFLAMLSAVYGEQLVPLVDDIDRYVLNVLQRQEDTFGGHFDDYPVSVVLVVEAPKPEFGGVPQLVPRAHSLADLDAEGVVEVLLKPGDAYILKADTTAHRVSPLRSDVDRVAFNLAYTTATFQPSFTPSANLLYSRATITKDKHPVVSYNEWDPLEEVVVGVAANAMFPAENRSVIEATMPDGHWSEFVDGNPFPRHIVEAAGRELDQLAHLLEGEGIVVRRPDSLDWHSLGGHTSAMPRDPLLVVGSTIIEAPMPWRSRQKEALAYRQILKELQGLGANWVSAPRVLDPDSLLDVENNDLRWVINNSQPSFDAADFLRFGRDIVGQLSHVTNEAGILWLQQFLGSDYRVHTLSFDDPHAMHIDASITPLKPGLMLYNPQRVNVNHLRKTLFARWELVPTPKPDARRTAPLYMTSGWVNMNLLVLDGERVFVEEQDEAMQSLLTQLGMKPIACPFQHVQSIGGSFHCATLDLRRNGTLETYL